LSPVETALALSPARPGAFNANFAPDTLEAFKTLCRQQGKKYTKVLEQFAELYLKSNGTVLEQMSVPSSGEASAASSSITTRGTYAEMLERLERVEADDREFVSAFEILIHRVEALEQKMGGTWEEPKHHPGKG
jgi:hypothetical protein